MIRGSVSGISERPPRPRIELHNVKVGDLIGNYRELQGKIDTGATATAIPLSICLDLQLRWTGRMREFQVVDKSFGTLKRKEYFTQITVPGIINDLPMRVIAVQRKTVLLGWDFLERVLFFLDGKRSKWAIERAESRRALFSLRLLWTKAKDKSNRR